MEKYVKVMPDYFSNGIWKKDGSLMSFNELNVEDDILIRKIVLWNYRWEKFFDDTMYLSEQDIEDNDYLKREAENLKESGLRVAKAVANYHTDWLVEYTFDGNEVIKVESDKLSNKMVGPGKVLKTGKKT